MSDALTLSVVIPTYKEVLNIPHISQAVADALGDLAYEVIFVDDNSQDGSVEAVEKISHQFPVRIEVRTEERGLSTAVMHGIEKAKGDYVVVMDADLSHPATAIPKMLEKLSSNEADFVVGSRYVKGGSFDEDWGFFRLLNSKIATWLALPICHVKDPMSGFFAFKRSNMPPIHMLSPLGYKIGLEIMVKGRFKKPMEVPIHFVDREHGESKLDFKEQLLYLRHLRRLYRFKFPSASEFLQFGMVGGTGFLVDTFFYWALQTFFGLNHTLARAISFWPAVTWNWFWNRTLTFSDRKKGKKLGQWAAFVGTSLYGFAINVGSYHLLTDYVPFFAEHKYLALMAGVLMGMGFNFMAARIFVFRKLDQEVEKETERPDH